MKRLKQILLLIFSVFLIMLISPFIAYKATDNITINVSAAAERITSCNGEYFYQTKNGIYKCGEPDKIVVNGLFEDFYVDSRRIYCISSLMRNNKKYVTVYVYDKETGAPFGTFSNTDGLEGPVNDGIMCVVSVQKATNRSILRFYDIYSDFREVSVVYDRKSYGDTTVFEFADGRPPVALSESNCEKIISVSKDYVVSIDNSLNADVIFNYRDLSAYNRTKIGKINTVHDSSDFLYLSYTENKSFFWEGNNYSRTDLKHNKFDGIKTIEQRTGKIISEKQLRRTERVLRYDENALITYYNGNYICYDTLKFKELWKIKATEIVEDGTYYVENCDNCTFIFDDNGLINKINYSNFS